jgi:hypothetical protein
MAATGSTRADGPDDCDVEADNPAWSISTRSSGTIPTRMSNAGLRRVLDGP